MTRGPATRRWVEYRHGPLGRASELGQATVVVALGVVLAMALLGAALAEWSYGQSTNSSLSTLTKMATQAAQAGVADYQARFNADPSYPLDFCSNDTGATPVPTGQWAGSACPSGTDADPNNPAFVNWFNQGSGATVHDTVGTCETSLSTQPTWTTVRGGNQSAGYQYVVDSTHLVNDVGTVYLYVAGRAGASGNYVCSSLATAFEVNGTTAPTTTGVANSTTQSSEAQLNGNPNATSQYVTFTLSGGQGGPGGPSTAFVSGGVGESITATFAIPTTDTILPAAGQAGSTGPAGAGTGYAAGGAGANGGAGNSSGGGGGASAACLVARGGPVTSCTSATVPTLCVTAVPTVPCVLAIAAGGGGGGQSLFSSEVGGPGGNGGYLTGSSGAAGTTTTGTPGNPGTGGQWNGLSGTGANAPSGSSGTGGLPGAGLGNNAPGSPGNGPGGAGLPDPTGAAGGGGGGGYYGGGGASSGFNAGAGGGAGGSSYVDLSAVVAGPSTTPAPSGNGSVSAPSYTNINSITKTWIDQAGCDTPTQVSVPGGATKMEILISGAGGGGGGSANGGGISAAGGSGSSTSATFTVNPSTLTSVYADIGCGGQGGSQGASLANGGAGGASTFASGGAGGMGLSNLGPNVAPGAGGGGGASAVCTSSPCSAANIAAALVAVGGGGGGGATGCAAVNEAPTYGTGGTAGTGTPALSAGGYLVPGGDGLAGITGQVFGSGTSPGGTGGPTTPAGSIGGAGANGNPLPASFSYGAGGGGGGWTGGAGATTTALACNGSGGGGGGSSYVAAGATTGPTFSAGSGGGIGGDNDVPGQTGQDGSLTIIWTIAVASAPAVTSCTTGVLGSTVPGPGKYSVTVAGGGGAPALVTTAGNGGTSGPGGLLSVDITGMVAGAPIAAVAGCQGTQTTGGAGYTAAGTSGTSICDAYDAAVIGEGPTAYWELNDPGGSNPEDSSGQTGNSSTVVGSVNQAVGGGPINCFNSEGPSSQGLANTVTDFTGAGFVTTAGPVSCALSATQAVSISVWFQTQAPGGIVGCNSGGGDGDRFLYVGQSGHLEWAPDSAEVVTSPGVVTDGAWHFAVATFSSAGTSLYLDGNLVAANPTDNTAAAFGAGSTWDFGETPSSVATYPDMPATTTFTGLLSRLAISDNPASPTGSTVLDARQVSSLFAEASEACTVDAALTADTDHLGTVGAYWPLTDAAGSTVANEVSGNQPADTGTLNGGVTAGTGGVLPCNGLAGTPTDTAMTFDGNPGSFISTSQTYTDPETFSVVAWFKTTAANGGGIIGFSDVAAPGTPANYDRMLYVGQDGRLVWGVQNNGFQVAESSQAYNDGQWHMAVATLGLSGQNLYVDGNLVASIPNTSSAYTTAGTWTIGATNTNPANTPWPDWYQGNGAMDNFTGSLSRVAVVPSVLGSTQVAQLFEDSGFVPAPSTCTAYDSAIAALEPPGSGGTYWPLDDTNASVAVDLSASGDFGAVNGGVTQGVNGPLACNPFSSATTFDGNSGNVTTSATVNNPQNFSIAGWFQITSGDSGVLASFSDGSSKGDRALWVGNSGLLNWETQNVNGTAVQVVQAPVPVTDGNWHYVVATSGSSGQYLYIDGTLAAYNTSYTSAWNYNGTWTLGAFGAGFPALANGYDRPAQSFFDGTMGRIAVLPGQLSESQVQSLYADAGYSSPTTVCSAAVTPYDEGMQALSPTNYWEMAETNGTQAYDQASALRTKVQAGGTISNDIDVVTGPISQGSPQQCPISPTNDGGAFGFQGNGGDGLQTAATQPSYAGNLTQMLWMNDSSGSGGGLMDISGPENDHFLYMDQNGNIVFSGSNANGTFFLAAPTVNVNDGNWHLVVAESITTGAQAGEYLYVDGNLVGYNANVNTITSNNVDWQLGTMSTTAPLGCAGNTCPAAKTFDGEISRAAVIESAVTLAQQRNLYQLATGAVPPGAATCQLNAMKAGVANAPTAIYTFATGTNDSSGSGAGNALQHNNHVPNISYHNVPGPALCNANLVNNGAAANFNGNGTNDITSPAGIANPNSNFSVGAWVKLASSANPQIIATNGINASGGFSLAINAGGTSGYFEASVTGGIKQANWSGITLGTSWNYIVGVYDGAHVTVYVNGNQVGQTAATGPVGNGTTGFVTIGSGNTGVEMADFEYYDSTYIANTGVLTAGFINAQYQQAATAVSNPVALTVAANTVNPAATSSCTAYDAAVLATDPVSDWELDDVGLGQATDQSGNANTGSFSTTPPTENVNPGPIGCASQAAANTYASPAMSFGGSSFIGTANSYANPSDGSLVVWFKTSSPGALLGFGDTQATPTNGTASTQFDRVLYVGTNGDLNFGLAPGGVQSVVSSANPVDDGQWHMAVATFGPAGQALYVDGALVGSGATTNGWNITGFWQMGVMPGTTAWPNELSSATGSPLTGDLGRVAIIPGQLSATQVDGLYQTAGVTTATNPVPQNTCTLFDAAVLGNSPSTYLELDDPSTVSFADASGNYNSGSMAGSSLTTGITPGPLNCLASQPANPAAASTSFGGTGTVTTPNAYNNPQAFSVVAWFSSFGGEGGLASFTSPAGYNGGVGGGDRMLYIGGSGDLDWTVDGTSGVTLSSATDVFNGIWHMAVATVCPATVCTAPVTAADEANGTAPGTYLYLDGKQVPQGWNSNTSVLSLSGYWQFGTLPAGFGGLADAPQGGANFVGYMGRDAVLPESLTAQQVAALYGDSFGGLGGGGGGSSAICLENPATYDPAYPNCQSTATTGQNGAPAEAATPLCSSALPWGTATGAPQGCVLAVSGGGGGGGFSSSGAQSGFLVCTVTGSGGGDGGPVSSSAVASALTGLYIPGAPNLGNTGTTTGGQDSTTQSYGGDGTNGTFGVPVASGGGGAGFGGGEGGQTQSNCGGGGGSTWYALSAPSTNGSGAITVTPHVNGPNTCIDPVTDSPSDDCPGYVDLTGPIVPPSGITLLSTHAQPVDTVEWLY